ncbi:MAG: hypothetical protein ACRDTH_14635 [Pseudonocardiaceae bacterium]
MDQFLGDPERPGMGIAALQIGIERAAAIVRLLGAAHDRYLGRMSRAGRGYRFRNDDHGLPIASCTEPGTLAAAAPLSLQGVTRPAHGVAQELLSSFDARGLALALALHPR